MSKLYRRIQLFLLSIRDKWNLTSVLYSTETQVRYLEDRLANNHDARIELEHHNVELQVALEELHTAHHQLGEYTVQLKVAADDYIGALEDKVTYLEAKIQEGAVLIRAHIEHLHAAVESGELVFGPPKPGFTSVFDQVPMSPEQMAESQLRHGVAPDFFS